MNKNNIVIGITGFKGSGKSTVAEHLRNEFYNTHRVKIIGFADNIKDEVAKILGTTVVHLEETKNTNPLVRHVLQWYGQHKKETHGETYWLNQLNLKIESLFESTDPTEASAPPYLILIPDVRFPFEAQYIKNVRHGKVLRVKDKRTTCNIDDHVSELSVMHVDADYTLDNTKTLLFLMNESKFAAEYIKQQYGLNK